MCLVINPNLTLEALMPPIIHLSDSPVEPAKYISLDELRSKEKNAYKLGVIYKVTQEMLMYSTLFTQFTHGNDLLQNLVYHVYVGSGVIYPSKYLSVYTEPCSDMFLLKIACTVYSPDFRLDRSLMENLFPGMYQLAEGMQYPERAGSAWYDAIPEDDPWFQEDENKLQYIQELFQVMPQIGAGNVVCHPVLPVKVDFESIARGQDWRR